MFMVVLEKAADSSWILTAALISQVVCLHLLSQKGAQIEALGGGPVPDARFGFSEQDLNSWYDAIGEEGCRLYQQLAFLDLFPQVQSYAILLGGLLLQQTRQAGVTNKLALAFPMMMFFDIIETCISAYGCRIHPDRRLKSELIQAAAAANQLKWIHFGIGMVMLTLLFLYTNLFMKQSPAEETRDDKKED